MTYDLYVWKGPRDLDGEAAQALVERWEADGGDPAQSPFEASTDIGWFYRELHQDDPTMTVLTDAPPPTSSRPVWLSSGDEQPPARVVAIGLTPGTTADDLDDIIGLATKYDLVLFDRRDRSVHTPLSEMAAYASATFWPRGAIQALVAGVVGVALAIGGFLLPIPIVNIVLVVVGGFLAVMSVFTFVHEGRERMRRRQG